MKKLISKIRFWFWWKFRATEIDKFQHDMMNHGRAIIKRSHNVTVRVNPDDFIRES